MRNDHPAIDKEREVQPEPDALLCLSVVPADVWRTRAEANKHTAEAPPVGDQMLMSQHEVAPGVGPERTITPGHGAAPGQLISGLRASAPPGRLGSVALWPGGSAGGSQAARLEAQTQVEAGGLSELEADGLLEAEWGERRL